MGFMNDFKRWVSGDIDEDDELDMDLEQEEGLEDEPIGQPYAARDTQPAPVAAQETSVRPQRRGKQVLSINATTKLAVVLVKADQFNNVADIADHLKDRMTVVLNLETTDKDVSKRMLDFLSGVTYAIEGKIKRVASDTYLITPIDVEIVGDDLISELEHSGLKF